MDRLAQLTTVLVVEIGVGLALRTWTNWSPWSVALTAIYVSLVAGYFSGDWWTGLAQRYGWWIYGDPDRRDSGE